MKRIKYAYRDESRDEQMKAGRYNPATQIKVQGFPWVTISAGTSDDTRAYVQNGLLVVASVNTGLEYCGVEVFDTAGEMQADAYLDNSESIDDVCGRNALDRLEHATIARRLYNHAMECAA